MSIDLTKNWVLLRTPQGNYLGQLNQYLEEEGVTYLELRPAFDYINHAMMAPDGRVHRQAVCLPFDNCADETTVGVYATNYTLVRLQDMSEQDRRTYHRLIEQAHSMAVAQRSNLVLSGNAS